MFRVTSSARSLLIKRLHDLFSLAAGTDCRSGCPCRLFVLPPKMKEKSKKKKAGERTTTAVVDFFIGAGQKKGKRRGGIKRIVGGCSVACHSFLGVSRVR